MGMSAHEDERRSIMNAALIKKISDPADGLEILYTMIEEASNNEVFVNDFVEKMTDIGVSREQVIAAIHHWVSDGRVRFTDKLGIAHA